MRNSGHTAPPDEWCVPAPFPAVTVIQPWASLIATGVKRIETRGWRISYRGPLMIHAGVSKDGERIFAYNMFHAGCGIELPPDRPRGAIVAIVRLIDCRPADEAPTPAEAALGYYGPGRWGWHMERPFRLPMPVTAQGRLGLWEVKQPALGAVLRQWLQACRRGEQVS